MNDIYILYNLVRQNITSMRYKDGYGGKALAQANHVGSLFAEHEIVRPLLMGMMPGADVMEWRGTNDPEPLGFGTCLTISVPDLPTMRAVIDTAQKLDFRARIQRDPSYPIILSNEVAALIDPSRLTLPSVSAGPDKTVCFIEEFPMGYVFGRKSEVSVLLSKFSLVPND